MTETKPGPTRRMGPPGSEIWHAMLDGAEDILREEGHAALTSRRIAERCGVKQRLVYYYFHTMDELIVEMFRRSSERDLARLDETRNSDMPLRQLWEICFDSHDARLISEYMALANRLPELRAEVVRFIETSRDFQVRALTDAIEQQKTKTTIPPSAIALMATSIGLSLNREEQLGVKSGHTETVDVLNRFLKQVES
jgi:AcrR family transcriptional regulator